MSTLITPVPDAPPNEYLHNLPKDERFEILIEESIVDIQKSYGRSEGSSFYAIEKSTGKRLTTVRKGKSAITNDLKDYVEGVKSRLRILKDVPYSWDPSKMHQTAVRFSQDIPTVDAVRELIKRGIIEIVELK